MFEVLIAPIAVAVLAFGPVVWRVWRDRREQAALIVRADVHRATLDALGGESYLSVAVEAPGAWRPGRVVLSAPAGWDCLIDEAASAALARLPDNYELVVKPSSAAMVRQGHDVARVAA